MAGFIFNVAKGKFRYYAELPAANDGLVWVILQSTGLQADAVLKDHATLASVLASNSEASFGGYARQAATGVSITQDDTNEWVTITVNNPSWNPTTAQAIGKILLCYDNDVGAGTDADIIPLCADDFAMTTPTSGTITYQVNASGLMRAAE
ncbi:MAG: hypothetical protein KatS3mg014_2535 [Actinomycetota bacterium]|nr:MAG: hypothetical protein KatS3mg014_2470 [Actinomycetota bacterium]GIV00920.1 MAG: hypothetical protein KatS3mg014_2535 [Actinomycetota bacterium]